MRAQFPTPSEDVFPFGFSTGINPICHTNESLCSQHLRPSERVLGQPCMTNASADVDDRSKAFKRFEATTLQFAVLSRAEVCTSPMLFFLSSMFIAKSRNRSASV